MKNNNFSKKTKIFIGPTEIAGNYRNLAGGFRQIGYHCDFFTYYSHPFEYGGESNPSWILKCIKFLFEIRARTDSQIIRAALVPLTLFFLIPWVAFAAWRYDVFIFGFGQTLIPKGYDLPLLRLLRKRVIINLAHGSEARPPYIDGAIKSMDGLSPDIDEVFALTKKRKNLVLRTEAYADVIIGSPFSTSQFASRPFINSFALGRPVISQAYNSYCGSNGIIDHCGNCDEVMILHAPSHPWLKGTASIEKAIENLKSKGHKIRYEVVVNRSNEDVLRLISQCDFVIDQLYSDITLSAFATEAALFAKPAVVGGYGLNRLPVFTEEHMLPPSQICHPDDLEDAIEELIVDPEKRDRMGKLAQKVINDNWNYVKVAEKYCRILDNIDIPKEWWINPKSVVYIEGCGQSVTDSGILVNQLLLKYGKKGLCLEHNSNLEEAFCKYYSS